MARRVIHEAAAPIKIDPATWPRDEQGNLKTLFLCACGISSKFPFCDASHKACAKEQPGCCYTYDPVTKQAAPDAGAPPTA